MSEQPQEELALSRGQRLASNLAAGGIVFLLGILLLMAGLGVTGDGFTLSKTALFLSLGAVGLILFVTAIIQKNTLSMWLSMCFLCPAVVTAVVNFTPDGVGYAQLYPVYIATPGIASLFAMTISRDFRFHVRFASGFIALAAVFALASSGLIGYIVLLPILVVLLGAVMLVVSVRRALRKKGDNPDA